MSAEERTGLPPGSTYYGPPSVYYVSNMNDCPICNRSAYKDYRNGLFQGEDRRYHPECLANNRCGRCGENFSFRPYLEPNLEGFLHDVCPKQTDGKQYPAK